MGLLTYDTLAHTTWFLPYLYEVSSSSNQMAFSIKRLTAPLIAKEAELGDTVCKRMLRNGVKSHQDLPQTIHQIAL
jgi:hypothetical protein